jgi:hypothetical protein
MYPVEAEEYRTSLYFILFQFIVFYFILLLSNIQGVSNECYLKRCVAFMFITLNRPILFSVHTHQSSWGICPTDDEFDCSKEEITTQCMFHPNNIVSFSFCSTMHSKSLTAASSWTTGNVLGSSPPCTKLFQLNVVYWISASKENMSDVMMSWKLRCTCNFYFNAL